MKRAGTLCLLGSLLAVAWLVRPPADMLTRADQAYREGDYARALELYRGAEQQGEPRSLDVVTHQAATQYRLQQFGDAARNYERAEQHSAAGQAARAAYDRGNAILQQACQDREHPDPALLNSAIEQYRTALERSPTTPPQDKLRDDARHNLELARLLQQKGQSSQANVAQQQQPSTTDPAPTEQSKKDQQARRGSGQEGSAENQEHKPEQGANSSDPNQQGTGNEQSLPRNSQVAQNNPNTGAQQPPENNTPPEPNGQTPNGQPERAGQDSPQQPKEGAPRNIPSPQANKDKNDQQSNSQKKDDAGKNDKDGDKKGQSDKADNKESNKKNQSEKKEEGQGKQNEQVAKQDRSQQEQEKPGQQCPT